MIQEQAEFELWKSRVEVYLEQMVKKSTDDFRYNYLQDFNNNVPPSITATRVVRTGYRQGGSNGISSKTKRPQTSR
jgi:hypothetical protein